MSLDEVRLLKASCSRQATKAAAEMRKLECQYNSAVYQWNRLDEIERGILAWNKMLIFARPEVLG